MNKKQIACYLELFKVIQRSEMLDDKQKKELDTFLANLKGKYDKHRKKNKRLIDYVERIREENKELQEESYKLSELWCKSVAENRQLHNKIDKAIEILKLCNSQCAKETIEVLKNSDVDDKKVNYEQQAKKFAELLIDMCFDDDFEDMEDSDWYRLKACQYDGWQETMCRWLFKFGYIDKTEDGNWCIKDSDVDVL